MNRKYGLRSLLAAGLLLSTAAAAYPWSAWLNARLMNGKVFGYYYYYNPSYETLFSFGPANGTPETGLNPVGGLTAVGGTLLGTTRNDGVAYALRQNAGAGWSQQVVSRLSGGSQAPLTRINALQLAGTEARDVFLLTLGQDAVLKTVIYSFDGGAKAASPSSGLTVGANGKLYGTATGGPSGNGFVYELTPRPDGTYGERALYTFAGGIGGAEPTGGVVAGFGGLLYGTTRYGGNSSCSYERGKTGCGVIYSLTASGQENVIHGFGGAGDGAGPGELTVDAAGDIVGATLAGGQYGYGAVFRLARSTPAALGWSRIYSFKNDTDGRTPNTKLAVDSWGAIYGTAQGGASGHGTVFVLVPSLRRGHDWVLTVLHTFTGARGDASHAADGAQPSGGLLIDGNGTLYGVTTRGGAHDDGVVYSVYP
jgi:uncharacterized repeat protein (TIGR03803 family)